MVSDEFYVFVALIWSLNLILEMGMTKVDSVQGIAMPKSLFLMLYL
jgi:hypothetical protein